MSPANSGPVFSGPAKNAACFQQARQCALPSGMSTLSHPAQSPLRWARFHASQAPQTQRYCSHP